MSDVVHFGQWVDHAPRAGCGASDAHTYGFSRFVVTCVDCLAAMPAERTHTASRRDPVGALACFANPCPGCSNCDRLRPVAGERA